MKTNTVVFLDKIDSNIINSIAQDIDCGEVVYYNSKTGEIISMPHVTNVIDEYEHNEVFREETEKIEANYNDLIIFEPPSSSEGFKIMEHFAQQLPDSHFKFTLLDVLEQRKPFRNFKNHIDNSDYREDWFDFKQKELERMVERIFESEL